ncbi:uncharacterized protein YodC (DUF2158 family) [Paraburkholderia atlantica]
MRTCTRTSKPKVRVFGSGVDGATSCEWFLGKHGSGQKRNAVRPSRRKPAGAHVGYWLRLIE